MGAIALPQVAALVTALSLAILTPGPAIIATVQTAFAHGRQRALPYGLGLATGASLWCLMALLGLALVFRLNPMLFSALKVFGGLYLHLVRRRPLEGLDRPPAPCRRRAAARRPARLSRRHRAQPVEPQARALLCHADPVGLPAAAAAVRAGGALHALSRDRIVLVCAGCSSDVDSGDAFTLFCRQVLDRPRLCRRDGAARDPADRSALTEERE